MQHCWTVDQRSEEPHHLVVELLGHTVGLVVVQEGGEVQLAGDLFGFLSSQSRSEIDLIKQINYKIKSDLESSVTTQPDFFSPSLQAE